MLDSGAQNILSSYLNNTDSAPKMSTSTSYSVPLLNLAVSDKTIGPIRVLGGCYNKYAYLEKDLEIISLEHCYARPTSYTSESNAYKPTKTIFMPASNTSKRKSTNPLAPAHEYDEVIDIESVPPDPLEVYDKEKAFDLMQECERHAYANRSDDNENWEDTVIRLNWTPFQHRLFNGMVAILNSDYLARLAYKGTHHEPVRRRIVIDKSVKRVRRLFASFFWDAWLAQWMHQLFIDHLNGQFLTVYIDILQTLKAKVPTFVDKMMFGPTTTTRIDGLGNENLFSLLKQTWDPYIDYTPPPRSTKLPAGAVIVMVPSAPSSSKPEHLKRQTKWTNLLSTLTTVVTVETNIVNSNNKMTMINCVDQMLSITRSKVQEVKTDMPGRPIILVGCYAGASLALQVAQLEHPACVICIGFSLLTAEGKRGEPDDNILELQSPVLFVIGQCSSKSIQEDVEDLRERLRVENGLIVVGAADDYLRINKKKKRSEGLTQNIVNRMVVDEIGDFICGLQNFSNKDRKRMNSTGSSIDSEPHSPTPRITKPVGRPPGSKSRAKMDAKRSLHLAQGISSSSSSPSITPSSQNTLSTPSSPTDTLASKPLSSGDHISSDIDTTAPDGETSILSQTLTKPTANRPPYSANKPYGVNSTLSNLLQGNYTTSIHQSSGSKSSSGIRVLENIKLNVNSKLLASGSRPLDLSKITVLNSMAGTKSTTGSTFVPEGKIKTISPCVKGPSVTLPASKRNKPNGPPSLSTSQRLSKYITSKKQLVGRRPPQHHSSLTPPSNLNIMDLPIIFADDGNMISSESCVRHTELPKAEMIPAPQVKTSMSNPVGKFVFVNKHLPMQGSVKSISTSSLSTKRPSLSIPPLRSTSNGAGSSKMATIFISRANSSETKANPSIVAKPKIGLNDWSKRANPANPESIDVETSLVATTIPKPDYLISNMKNDEVKSAVSTDSKASGKRSAVDDSQGESTQCKIKKSEET